MKNSLEKQIYLRCPIIFRNRDAGMQSNLMCFGFDCGDGWYQLIYDLSAAIEDIAQELKKQGVPEPSLPVVVQVKEKFGALCYYVHNMNREIDELIEAAEDRSEATCEICGQPGKMRGPGWMRTRCDKHERLGDVS